MADGRRSRMGLLGFPRIRPPTATGYALSRSCPPSEVWAISRPKTPKLLTGGSRALDSAAAMAGLPRILELKRTWDGREKRFACTVLERADPHLVVLFVSPVEMRVKEVVLPAGTVTLGHFW